MGVLKKVEQRIEGLVNGGFAKVFKSEIQPVEIAAALQRECDTSAVVWSGGRTMVPNDFAVELGPQDYRRFSIYATQLCEEFADMVGEYAQAQRYSFAGRLVVRLEETPQLGTGVYRVRSRIWGRSPAPAAPPDAQVYQTAAVRADCWLEAHGERFAIPGPAAVLGRGADADIPIEDPGVSRRHARIQLGPTAMLIDLGSTNGLVVDGRQVRRAPLHDGSMIVMGSTALVFRRADG